MSLAATVHDLPAELLLAIFRLVFTSSYSICSPRDTNCMTCRRIGTPHVAWGPTEAFIPADPALFPFALAAVLPRWRAILATIPEYWTRPVFFVDDPPTNATDVCDFLRYSQSLPIEVYITRRNFPAEHDPHERERVRTVIEALKPHLSRCQYLFIRVSRSSSLPSLRHDFVGEAPYLTQLKLECDIDDGFNPVAHAQPIPADPFHCPALYTLLIDGPNFSFLAVNHARWWASAFNTLRSLIIRNLTSHPVPFSFALSRLNVHTLSDLRMLTLSNVSFDTPSTPTFENTSIPIIYPFALQMLTLIQTPFPFLSHFFRHTFLGDLYSIRIESCTFPSTPDNNPNDATTTTSTTTTPIIPNTFSLTLRNITHPSHLIALIRTWGGRRLNLDSCPGFDDSVIEMMCSPLHSSNSAAPGTNTPHQHQHQHQHQHDANNPITFGCPNLSLLYLTDCTNFTPQGIQRLVQVRNQFNGIDTGAIILPTGVIELVTVMGHGPTITEAEKNHFAEHQVVKWDANSTTSST